MRYNLIMTPKHIKLPDGKIVPVLGWVKDLYRIPGGHIKMKLAQPVDDADTQPAGSTDGQPQAVEPVTVGTVPETAAPIDRESTAPKKAGRPRRVRVSE